MNNRRKKLKNHVSDLIPVGEALLMTNEYGVTLLDEILYGPKGNNGKQERLKMYKILVTQTCVLVPATGYFSGFFESMDEAASDPIHRLAVFDDNLNFNIRISGYHSDPEDYEEYESFDEAKLVADICRSKGWEAKIIGRKQF